MKMKLTHSRQANNKSILRVVGGIADTSNPLAVIHSDDERMEIIKRVNMHDQLVEFAKRLKITWMSIHSDVANNEKEALTRMAEDEEYQALLKLLEQAQQK